VAGRRASSLAILFCVVGAAVGGAQQPSMGDMPMPGAMQSLPLGISPTREASGTSWVPDNTVHAEALFAGLSLHGDVTLGYDRQSGLRHRDQLSSLNWLMLTSGHPLGGGLLRLRTMLSAEALTVPEPGYPELLQTAFAYKGETISDREHPEAPVMEAALLYERALSHGLASSIYIAPVGEPALGPANYLHRPSAAFDPIAPLGHLSQDGTHVSYGTGTLGLFTRRLKVEASIFNSAHPDPGAGFAYHVHLNSWSSRVSWNPGQAWSVSASGGHLAPSTGAHAHDAAARLGISAMRVVRAQGGTWSTAFLWGADVPTSTNRAVNTLLGESTLAFSRQVVFGRAEYVQRTSADLALIGSVPSVLALGAVSAGYGHRLAAVGSFQAWAEARGTVNLLPPELELFYGTRHPVGLFIGVGARPGEMAGGL
jgi:hypothetical protein